MFVLFKIIFFIIFSITTLYAENLNDCEWDNRKGVPCIVISKTPNTSEISEIGINKIVISKKDGNYNLITEKPELVLLNDKGIKLIILSWLLLTTIIGFLA